MSAEGRGGAEQQAKQQEGKRLIDPAELDPAALEAAYDSFYAGREHQVAEAIAAYLNHRLQDDEAMRRAVSYYERREGGETNLVDRFRATLLAAVRGGEASKVPSAAPESERCPTCKGAGRVPNPAEPNKRICPVCGGTGKQGGEAQKEGRRPGGEPDDAHSSGG